MEKNGIFRMRFWTLSRYIMMCCAAICLVHCDATLEIHRSNAFKHFRNPNTKSPSKLHALRNIDIDMPLDSSNIDPYVSSPFSLPPYESLPPFGLPENTPPFCIDPPSTPLPPTIPSPIGDHTPSSPPPASAGPTFPGPSPPTLNPPTIIPSPPSYVPTPTEPGLSPTTPNPPTIVPSPPSYVPTPTEPGLNPPYYEPSPPSGYLPGPSPPSSPPFNIPSPSGSFPSPRFLPPIIYPPPTVPPPPHRAPVTAMWCVAKPSVPDPIIQEAMNYACGSGADCDQIQSSGSCFQPNTILAHASYAFNSYWQRTKVAGGTCDFGGTALLVTVDPSYDGCNFNYF